MKIPDTAALGKAIRKRRKELGYTQSFLCEFTGFSVSFICDVEKGKPTVELGRVLTLAQTLGLDMELSVRGQ